MAEQERNYLDVEATAAQVKKGIEEVVDALTANIFENNNKVFTLEVEEGLNIGSSEEDLLNGVKIRLKKVSAISPIEINKGEMPIGDGEDWLKKSHLYSSFFPTGDASNGAYTEVRFGPDMITEPNIPYPNGQIGYSTSRFVISGNPLAIEDETNLSTSMDTRIKANDAKTFKMVIAETAKATFEDNSNFSVDSKGLHFAADNNNWGENRFTLTDGANMDVTGDVSGSPQVYIHGKCFLNLDRGYDPYYKKYNYTGNNAVVPIDGATIAMHDKAMLAMSEGAYVTASDTAKAYFQGTSLLQMNDQAQAHFTGGAYFMATGASKTYFENNSELYMQGGKMYMNGGAITLNAHGHQYTPCIHMNGGGTILFNASENVAGPIGSDLDPALVANPTSFVLVGQLAKGVGNYGNPQLQWGSLFGDWSYLTPTNRNPRIQIGDETMIMIDAAYGKGANWIKIGAADGGLVHISLTGNIFHQMNGNAYSDMSDDTHFEMHQNAISIMMGNAHFESYDDSIFVMRGKTALNKPWLDGDYIGHNDKNWLSPVKASNSPLLGMYDTSQFTMRGVWDTEKDLLIYTSTITLTDLALDEEFSTIEEMPEDVRRLIFMKMNEYSLQNKRYPTYWGFDNEYDLRTAHDEETGDVITEITLTLNSSNNYNLTVKNICYTTCPPDWKEHLDKIEDQPVVEIIENADVRIYGNSELKLTDYSIIANSEGFTFKDNFIGEEVSFSISELKELKKLLSGATITE